MYSVSTEYSRLPLDECNVGNRNRPVVNGPEGKDCCSTTVVHGGGEGSCEKNDHTRRKNERRKPAKNEQEDESLAKNPAQPRREPRRRGQGQDKGRGRAGGGELSGNLASLEIDSGVTTWWQRRARGKGMERVPPPLYYVVGVAAGVLVRRTATNDQCFCAGNKHQQNHRRRLILYTNTQNARKESCRGTQPSHCLDNT